MNTPAVRHWGKVKRARNLEAKALRSDPQFRMQVRANRKKKEEQRKWREKEDPAGDYDSVDGWLLKDWD